MKFKTALSLTALLSINILKLSAQTTTEESNIELKEVVVTGSPTRVEAKTLPNTITIIGRNEIEESEESAILPILNGRVPGLFVSERGITGFGVGDGAGGNITMRGVGGAPTTGVLMLIDGHPQYMGLFGHPLADTYISSDIESIEVIRGPASVLYGSNAMGGVINIITKDQKQEGLHGNANLKYGSYNTQKYMASAGYKKNKLTIFASLNHDQTDGHRANSDFSIYNEYLKVAYRFNSHITAQADFSLANFKASDPGADTLNALPGSKIDIERGYWAIDVANNYEKVSGIIKLFSNFGNHTISDGYRSSDINNGIALHESVKLLPNNTITLGADLLQVGGDAKNVYANQGNGVSFVDTSLTDMGIYGFVQQSLFERLTLTAGLRLQIHEAYGKHWIPSGGFAFKVADNTTWKGAFSKGFRSPTIKELYMWKHNEDLAPEEVTSYETGIHNYFVNNRVKTELTAFWVDGTNMIVALPYQAPQNNGAISNKGIEFSTTIKPLPNISTTVTYAYIAMDKPTYATPKHHLFASCSYRYKHFSLSSSLRYINNLDTDASKAINLQSYTLLNGKVAYQFNSHISMFISANNLLNQHYETNRYYTMPGVVAFSGIKCHF